MATRRAADVVVNDEAEHRRDVGIREVVRDGQHQEEMRLAMVSVPERDFFSVKNKNKVPHLFNRNFGGIFDKLSC